MEYIEDAISDYVNRANCKISELSSEANDLLNSNGCGCDISTYVDDINDINSSLYILSKMWENITPTFGYENFLTVMFSDSSVDIQAATLEIIGAYIDRYSMGCTSVMVSPLFPFLNYNGCGCGNGGPPTIPSHNNLLGLYGDSPYYHLGVSHYEAISNSNNASGTNPVATIDDLIELESEIQADLDLKANISDLSDLAFSGDWEDILNKPISLKDIPVTWIFDGNKTYNIPPEYYLHQINFIRFNRVDLESNGLDYTEDPNSGVIILGELTNPNIGNKIYMNLKVIEV